MRVGRTFLSAHVKILLSNCGNKEKPQGSQSVRAHIDMGGFETCPYGRTITRSPELSS